MTPWKKLIRKALAKTAWGLFGATAWASIVILGKLAWEFIYNTNNQFGHIVVAVIVGLAWIAYAIVAAVVGFIAVTND